MALETDNERFTRAPHRVMLDRPNLDALTNIVITETTKLRADEILEVFHFLSVKFGRLVIDILPLRDSL